MFSQKVLGKYISRIVCMVMFVLIQFDVFGYDLIYASSCDGEQPAVIAMDDDSSLSGSQDRYSEWSDPVYRSSSVRFFHDSVYPLFLTCVYSFGQPGLYIRPFVSKLPIYITDSHHYILFRTLLI